MHFIKEEEIPFFKFVCYNLSKIIFSQLELIINRKKTQYSKYIFFIVHDWLFMSVNGQNILKGFRETAIIVLFFVKFQMTMSFIIWEAYYLLSSINEGKERLRNTAENQYKVNRQWKSALTEERTMNHYHLAICDYQCFVAQTFNFIFS